MCGEVSIPLLVIVAQWFQIVTAWLKTGLLLLQWETVLLLGIAYDHILWYLPVVSSERFDARTLSHSKHSEVFLVWHTVQQVICKYFWALTMSHCFESRAFLHGANFNLTNNSMCVAIYNNFIKLFFIQCLTLKLSFIPFSLFDCLIPWPRLQLFRLNPVLPSVYSQGIITVTSWAEASENQSFRAVRLPCQAPGAGYTVCTQHYLTSASRISRVSRAWLTGTDWKREGGR